MKLGTKGKDVDQFVDQLKSEGESEGYSPTLYSKQNCFFCRSHASETNCGGRNVSARTPSVGSSAGQVSPIELNEVLCRISSRFRSIHVESKEEIKLNGDRNGGLENMEITGVLTFRVADDKNAKLAIKMDLGDNRAQIQVNKRFFI